jgi:hypothetical protein
MIDGRGIKAHSAHLDTGRRVVGRAARAQAWRSVISGACGQFFCSNPIWYFDGRAYNFANSKSAPTSGDFRPAEGAPLAGGQKHTLTPPGPNAARQSDWVVLVELNPR